MPVRYSARSSDTEEDLIPDLETKTITVKPHHLNQSAHDHAIRPLCEQLNATEPSSPTPTLSSL